jgi:hypothetical protein
MLPPPVKVYMIDDKASRLCCLQRLLQLVNDDLSGESLAVEDGFTYLKDGTMPWGFATVFNLAWWRKVRRKAARGTATAERHVELLAQAPVLLQAIRDINGIVLLDLNFSGLPKRLREEVVANLNRAINNRNDGASALRKDLFTNAICKNELGLELLTLCLLENPAGTIINSNQEEGAMVVTGLKGYKLPSIRVPDEPHKMDETGLSNWLKAAAMVIARIARQKLDLKNLYLYPPGVTSGLWFDRYDGAHGSMDHLFPTHLAAIRQRLAFPKASDEQHESVAKALFFREDSDVPISLSKGCPRKMPAWGLSVVLPGVNLEDRNEDIMLPVTPGLPFLLAAERFFQTLNSSNVRRVFRVIDQGKGLAFLGLEVSSGMNLRIWVSSWLHGHGLDRAGDARDAFWSAIHSEVISDDEFKQLAGRKPEPSKILLMSLLGPRDTRGARIPCVVPWVTETAIGFCWHAVVGREVSK